MPALDGKKRTIGVSLAILIILLVLSPLNSKIAGACWLFLFILGVWSFKFGVPLRLGPRYEVVKIWFGFCVLALGLRAIPQFYWGDSWEERHAEFRLLIGAFGLIGLVRYGRMTAIDSRWLGYGAVIAAWAGFCLIAFWGLAHVPTNQIPWGASMALITCLVLPLALNPSPLARAKRLFYASGVIAGLCAVFLSQARGSYGIALWVGGVLLWYLFNGRLKWQRFIMGLLVAFVFSGLLVQMLPNIASVPVQRVELAVAEFSSATNAEADGVNSSVGARIYMWQRAISEIPNNLLLGIGHDARKAAIQSWGNEANAPAVSALGHLHSDYLQSIFDHGLFALLSFLAFGIAILLMAFLMRKVNYLMSLGLMGILFMHSTSSLTNMNFAHNYYPTMLSVAITLCFLIHLNDDFIR